MTDDKAIQADMHRAEADLEDKLGQLKDMVKDKIETPKHVIETAEKPISWIAANPYLAAGIAAAAGVGLYVLRALWHRHKAAQHHHLLVLG
jgi:ElaB/YqjD/DUF883 family membrane-anchored ribosome-binding protein